MCLLALASRWWTLSNMNLSWTHARASTLIWLGAVIMNRIVSSTPTSSWHGMRYATYHVVMVTEDGSGK